MLSPDSRTLASLTLRGNRLAFCVTKNQIFADQRRGLRIQFFGKFRLQDGFVRIWRREKVALHAVECAALFRRFGHSGNHRGERFSVEAYFREKPDLRIDLDYIWQLRDFHSRCFVEGPRFGSCGTCCGRARARSAKIRFRRDENGVEESALGKAARCELLQSHTERKHGDE